jgi:hypothetical protein
LHSPDQIFQENETCVGAEQIRQKVARLNLHGTVIDLSKGSIDAQKVADNRILVVVNGAYSAPSQASRFFMNTFLLVGVVSLLNFYYLLFFNFILFLSYRIMLTL